ncbi:MAG: FecR family protein [Treponema sp.]|jgi:hypothetical protein|nr:FecR family protein [Treponema sp.]
MKTIAVYLLLMMIPVGIVFSQTPEARFLEVNGVVEIKEPGTGASSEWARAAPGDPIKSNTLISTGLKSRALISLGASRLEVRPLTMLTLQEIIQRDNAEETILYLRTGRVRAVVNPPSGQSVDFTVSSPIVTASVRGTSFEFDGAHLLVDDGRVLLTSPNGQKVYVAGTQRSYVDEINQNRITPPFEAEAALLRPVIPELTNTGSNTEPPETTIAPGSDSTLIYIGWP